MILHVRLADLAPPDSRSGHLVGTLAPPEVKGQSRVRSRVDTGNLDKRARASAAATGYADLSTLDV
jgi:hypothetical protein